MRGIRFVGFLQAVGDSASADHAPTGPRDPPPQGHTCNAKH